jgi:hypothetical protein
VFNKFLTHDTIFSMVKYKQCIADMLEYNKELFDTFKKVHDNFAIDPKKWQQEFNETGEEALAVIRKYERILCGHSESGKYAKFSGNLADKYWEELRKMFPKIDFVGQS